MEATSQTTTESLFSIEEINNTVQQSSPSWDIVLVGVFLVGILLYSLSLGKDRIIAMMMSIYMAVVVETAFVNAAGDTVLSIKINEDSTLRITAFLSVFVVLFFILSRKAVINALPRERTGRWWQTVLFSVLHVGLLFSVVLSFLPAPVLARFSEPVLYVFTNAWMQFVWIIAPIISMIIVGRTR